MRPRFSIITPVLGTPAAWLLEGFRSLCRQPVSWEWLIQWDGPAEALPEEVAVDARVRMQACGIHCGKATARNLALERATAPLVLLMDADDQIADGGLAALAEAMEGSNYGWASGAHLRLEDGELTKGRGLEPCIVEPGQLVQHWIGNGHSWPHLASITCYRTTTLLAEGGFIGLSRSEDIVDLALFSERHTGIIVNHTTAIRRVHSASTSRKPPLAAQSPATYRLLLAILAARGRELDSWTPPTGPPPPGSERA